MVFLYNEGLERRCWRVDIGSYWHVLAPDVERGRPGGIVLFTSQERATDWLAWVRRRGAELDGHVVPCRGTLGQTVEMWRSFMAQAGAVTSLYSVFVLDPRPSAHPAERWDAEGISFDPILLPSGMVLSELGRRGG